MNTKDKIKKVNEFLETLKIHNKDLDVCFNDHLAKGHLMDLIESIISQTKQELTEEIKKEWEEFKDRHSLNDMCNVHDAWDFWIYRYKRGISQTKQELTEEINKKVTAKMRGYRYTLFGECMYCKAEWVSGDNSKHDKYCPMGKLEQIIELLEKLSNK